MRHSGAEKIFCVNALIFYDCDFGPSDIVNEKNGFLIPLQDKKTFIEKLQLLINYEELLNPYMKVLLKNWKKEKIIKKWELILI